MGTLFSNWTMADVERHQNRIKSQQTLKNTQKEEKPIVDRSRNKYGNVKTEINGVVYDSKKEARRALELEQLEKAGKIRFLKRQQKFVLQPSFFFFGKTIREISYVADFVYEEDGKTVIEDVKSPATRNNAVYKLKKKMLMYTHKIEIREV